MKIVLLFTYKEKTMPNNITIINQETLKNKIYTIRGIQVMLDFDLARIYGYSTKRFNEQVQRNIDKFDEDFRFQLTEAEFSILRSQIATSSWGGSRYLPYAFSEQNVDMLNSCLRSKRVVEESVYKKDTNKQNYERI